MQESKTYLTAELFTLQSLQRDNLIMHLNAWADKGSLIVVMHKFDRDEKILRF